MIKELYDNSIQHTDITHYLLLTDLTQLITQTMIKTTGVDVLNRITLYVDDDRDPEDTFAQVGLHINYDEYTIDELDKLQPYSINEDFVNIDIALTQLYRELNILNRGISVYVDVSSGLSEPVQCQLTIQQ